jgi:valyl-tRNA synthetase
MSDDKTLSKVYDPKAVEEGWMQRWLEDGLTHAEASSDKPPFCIVIPPPNVTGVLHMGHALNNTLQDILCRYKRMKGFNVLWILGTDHAGIATQNVVERKLATEGKSRHDLEREAFIKEVWAWKEEHGGHIVKQLKRLGASCDWGRERFTMDAGLSKAVREAFVHFYEKGLIYRDLYLINWCPRCHTALSDLEVEHEPQKGHLWHVSYAFQDLGASGPVSSQSFSSSEAGSESKNDYSSHPTCPPGCIVVATTRPETMLGDTAVAVHPDDERYKDLIGKTVVLPLVNKEIPIIADHRVDKEFGSGAVKITPAHDFNDYQMGKDHDLEQINILTDDGKMNENAIHFRGQDRFECRKNIIQELEEKGFLVETEDHELSVGQCYRCKTVVEPYLSMQWFVDAKPLADKALQAVRDKRTQFHPASWTKTYENWMENIQPWCISRQIWWGHRVPAWYCSEAVARGGGCLVNGEKENHQPLATNHKQCAPIVAREKPEKCPHCGDTKLEQDSDVLDTWFSSGLWPFSTLGWPEQTEELKTFYPTSVLVTAFDIIFFWVARMMMMGLALMDEVPFKDVYIHALVRDAEGKKMSKSKGNVIDPLEIMDKFGTDAFRCTLTALAAQGRDVKLSEEVIQGYRNFCNKIWNASRFALMNLEGFEPSDEFPSVDNLSTVDRWILFRLSETVKIVAESIEHYHYDQAAKSVYHFFWHNFCDWYLEFSKLDLQSSDLQLRKRAQLILYHVLDIALTMMHPIMPFITEEISQRLPGKRPNYLDQNAWPQDDWTCFKEDAQKFEKIMALIEMIRTIRGENGINPSQKTKVYVKSARVDDERNVQGKNDAICFLTKTEELTLCDEKPTIPYLAHGVAGSYDVYIPLEGLVDIVEERQRLAKEIGKLEKDEERITKKLGNKDFIGRAPEDVVTEQKEKLNVLGEKLSRLRETLENLQ